jgi:hypothetical protein
MTLQEALAAVIHDPSQYLTRPAWGDAGIIWVEVLGSHFRLNFSDRMNFWPPGFAVADVMAEDWLVLEIPAP